jgi:Protein of unknown function (DUF5818)
MKRISVTILMLLLCSLWALAQQDSSQSSKSGSSSQTSVKGCLSRSGSDYTLTDKSGTTFKLTGDTSKLSDHVGHEVQITGTENSASSSAASSTASSSSQPTIDVSSMKHISETCSSQSKSDSQKPPMSEKPPR